MRQRGQGKHCLQAVNEDFESAVEYFFNFGRFCSTLVAGVGGFGCMSRQNSVEKPVFCLLWRLGLADLGAGVDKIRWKRLFFVYFRGRGRWI